MVSTDRRLVFVDKKLIGNRVKVEDFPYDKITSIQYETKVMSANVTIYASGNKAEMQIFDKKQTRQFCESVRAMISGKEPEGPKQSTPEPTAPRGYGDVLDTLERLGKLHDSGVLNDDEFESEKQKVLAHAH